MEQTKKICRCSSSSKLSSDLESEELERLENDPPFWRTRGKKRLWKQLSLRETPRNIAWEKRRRQMFQQERKNRSFDLTDEDLNELKGCIELGFGFKEEDGQMLCNTLPALDLYFAVNRQYCTSSSSSNSPSTPRSRGSLVVSPSSLCLRDRSSSYENLSSESTNNNNSWKICSPGDDPQQVKIKLRQWAQVVACSVMQSH